MALISLSLLKKGQSENPIKCRNFILQNAKKQILQKVKVLPKRFHLSGHNVGFLPQTQKLEPPYNSGIERVKTNNFRLPKNEKKGGLKKLNITYTCTYTHHHHQKGLNDVILCSLPMTGHCRWHNCWFVIVYYYSHIQLITKSCPWLHCWRWRVY